MSLTVTHKIYRLLHGPGGALDLPLVAAVHVAAPGVEVGGRQPVVHHVHRAGRRAHPAADQEVLWLDVPEHEPQPVQLLHPVQRLQREDEAGLQREPAPAELQQRVKYF